MKKYTYKNIINTLKNNAVVSIDFIKVDGTARTIKGSLNSSLIPEEHTPKGEKKLKLSKDAIRVYDIENNGWRSFRVDSVTSVKIT